MTSSARQQRHRRVRARVKGKINLPRMSVFRSSHHLYIQLIDDENGKTLVSASTKEIKNLGKKTELAAEVGKLVGKKAQEAGITQVVFDRGGYKYHGRVKSVAEGAREAGLKF